jgi:hypothetical protein
VGRVAALRFEAVLWRHEGNAAWHFITVPSDATEMIQDSSAARPPRGFGSVRVRVTIGSSTWDTSVFPESKEHYVLPIKKPVRVKEGLEAGSPVAVSLELID